MTPTVILIQFFFKFFLFLEKRSIRVTGKEAQKAKRPHGRRFG
jgi:hypothetical protein